SAEFHHNRQVHGSRVAVEHGGLVLRLLDRIESGAMKKRGAGKDFHSGDIPGCVDERVNLNLAGDMLGFGNRWILGRNRFYKLRRLDVTTYRERRSRSIVV